MKAAPVYFTLSLVDLYFHTITHRTHGRRDYLPHQMWPLSIRLPVMSQLQLIKVRYRNQRPRTDRR